MDDDIGLAPQSNNNDVYNQAVESFLRVSLAGFGGALVGLSLARARKATPLTRTVGQRGKPFHKSVQDLPAQWAVAFLTFSSVFEATRILSPTSIVLDMTTDDSTVSRHWKTIGDYTMGGCMAGAVLRGMPVSAAGSTRGIAAPPRLGAGLLSGMVLGFIPGVMIAGIQMLEEKLEAYEAGTRQHQEDDKGAATNEVASQIAPEQVPLIDGNNPEARPDDTKLTDEPPKKKKGLLGLGWLGL